MTKREWKFNRKYAPTTHALKVSSDLFSSITSGDSVICFLPEPHYMPDMGDRTYYKESVDAMIARGKLIASAPDLYEALKFLASRVSIMGYFKPEKQEEIRQTLAKAEGK